jgi:hypothetical protein
MSALATAVVKLLGLSSVKRSGFWRRIFCFRYAAEVEGIQTQRPDSEIR